MQILLYIRPEYQWEYCMLIDFTMRNFMSFRDEVSLSMVASNTVKECEEHEGNSNITVTESGKRYLRTAAIYGANGSGKSTVVAAMSLFKSMVLQSFVNEAIVTQLSNLYYHFDTDSQIQPVSLQIIFVCNGQRYRYGFEVKDGKILSEWLFILGEKASKESYCLKREGQEIKVNSRIVKGARGVETKTRSNALYLSTAAQFNVEVAMTVKEWFRKRFNIISGLNDDTLLFTARAFIHNPTLREQILSMIGYVDACIKHVDVKENVKEIQPQNASVDLLNQIRIHIPAEIRQRIEQHSLDIQATHELYEKGKVVGNQQLSFKYESLGTTKLFALLGPFFDTIQNGGVLVIDEFGASLHTQLSMELLKLFYTPMNVSGAQLIVTTHDTNLLRKDLLRRDQIWFVEKSPEGVSDLYSLVEYKINQANSVRNDASFSKDYLLGRYGAIPYFGPIEKFVADYGKQPEEIE